MRKSARTIAKIYTRLYTDNRQLAACSTPACVKGSSSNIRLGKS